MKTASTRKIVKIDPDKCNGCGACVPSCAEGAIRIVDGKARLMADNLCDGLGNCLGECPQGAITIEERPAEQFDEKAVGELNAVAPLMPLSQSGNGQSDSPPFFRDPSSIGNPQSTIRNSLGGCPGSMLRKLSPVAMAPAAAPGARPSRLSQWPVQLMLLPVQGAVWENADVLFAADCVPFALADFHERLLAGKTLAIACPKLDDTGVYIEKLAGIFAANNLKSITVAHMEVPCCFGLERLVRLALEKSGKNTPVKTVQIGIDGAVQDES